MDKKFSECYEALYGKPLAEPTNQQDVKGILECIRAQHGYLDENDQAQLEKMETSFREKMKMIAGETREVLARYTKAQLYDDPFRFFFELLQNADDAKYRWSIDPPAMSLTISPSELIVDLNEDGFCLSDVLAICATGRSSKKLNEETTGEKGFGFKAVFGIADQVHVQSGLWSFRFKHQQHEDGIGMISPLWEAPKNLNKETRTRFTLKLSNTGEDSLQNLCDRLDSLHPSIVFALRQLKMVSIKFEDVVGRNYERRIERHSDVKKSDQDPCQRIDLVKITSQVADKKDLYVYRVFRKLLISMPKQPGRRHDQSEIRIGFPIAAHNFGTARKEVRGQYTFAYLPIVRIPQLHFAIHADFLLTASRQGVLDDHPWNVELRDGIARLFVHAVGVLVREKTGLSYDWLTYVPDQPLSGFWAPLQSLVMKYLSTAEVFCSMTGDPGLVNTRRILPKYFRHHWTPLFSDSKQSWRFLSLTYGVSHTQTLKMLGVNQLSCNEALELLCEDTSNVLSTLRERLLSDPWHDSFLGFVQHILSLNISSYKRDIETQGIIPVRNKSRLEWWRPAQIIYFPALVDQLIPEQIKLTIPTDLGLVVLHPHAAISSTRRQIYKLLGVRDCLSQVVCNAVERVQFSGKVERGEDALRHLELLFLFSEKSLLLEKRLIARTANGSLASTKDLFMRSKKAYHAESLARLAENPSHQRYFLDSMYQNSVISTIVRNGLSWEQWLTTIAGIRWFPPLMKPGSTTKLHWLLEEVLTKSPAMFLPLIQEYWSEEYVGTCISNNETTEALKDCKVLCRNGISAKLKDTWFPAPWILEAAKSFGVETKLPILDLPPSTEDFSPLQWPCLTFLGVESNLSLSFYQKALSLLSDAHKAPEVSITSMGLLYQKIGSLAMMQDRASLQTEFRNNRLVWDPSGNSWRTLDECVWGSPIPLNCRFVIMSSYEASAVSALFGTLVQCNYFSVDILIEELLYLRLHPSCLHKVSMRIRVTEIYFLTQKRMVTDQHKDMIRSAFVQNALVYDSKRHEWLNLSSCVWHNETNLVEHTAIADMYPTLKEFFVDTLQVSTMTDVFMMKQLASVAFGRGKNMDDIKSLMLSTSALLTDESQPITFEASVNTLRLSKFLPCKQPGGQVQLCTPTDSFFIVDNQHVAEQFAGKLKLLDFSYKEVNYLNQLFRILGIGDRYITRHIRCETSAESSEVDFVLTEQFHQCAYALSCCAVSHRSPRYSYQDDQMHDSLLKATIRTSRTMSTKLVVEQDEQQFEVESVLTSPIVLEHEDGLTIALPFDGTNRTLCMRSSLPQQLTELLQIYDSRAERQIYRILNEVELGTDEILLGEQISKAPWLSYTYRPNTISQTSEVINKGTQITSKDNRIDLETARIDNAIPTDDVTATSGQQLSLSQPIASQALTNHEKDAPEYPLVVEHIKKQVNILCQDFRDTITPQTTLEDIDNALGALSVRSIGSEPDSQLSLFGTDVMLRRLRINAAGELFAFEILRQLTKNKITHENWQSKFRHFVQPHNLDQQVTQLRERRQVDVISVDNEHIYTSLLLLKQFGADQPEWLPTWLLLQNLDKNIPLEWLFEVKTTIGPCETDFYMSENQYNLMRKLGQESDIPRKQVYCIVRVYNLLSDKIGIRFFIDPWRFRNGRLRFGTTDQWKVTLS